jgi:hypothetical protein
VSGIGINKEVGEVAPTICFPTLMRKRVKSLLKPIDSLSIYKSSVSPVD